MYKVLVVGGAGYIGSHMVKMLSLQGCDVTVLDDLSSGYRHAILSGKFIEGSCGDNSILESLLSIGFDAVMHFASCIQVEESMQNPAKYYQNNVVNTIALVNALCKHGIKNFIFSSSAAIFGQPSYLPIDEAHPRIPINPYGRSKLIIEELLADYERAYGLKSVCLRYFNAAGADPDNQLGEQHDPETHLIPLVLQAASGRRSHITIYGEDYDTFDGTCVRDYIHVWDICSAHWLSLKSLLNGGSSQSYNLGNGGGFSIRQVIDTARFVTGESILVESGPRRIGDPPSLVADSNKLYRELAWQPRYSSLETIIKHAWMWEQKHQDSR